MRKTTLLALLLAPLLLGAGERPRRTLRVCADPSNLPMTNWRGEGFENRIAAVLADELDAELSYSWWPQRRGFFRNTLNEKRCDVVLGVPAGLEVARTTRPYYRSSYAFVTRAERKLAIRSLDDARLRTLRIGVQVIGDDGASAPPEHALARRGIVDNVIGYSVLGEHAVESPLGAIVHAVARSEIDVAIVWGPLAGPVAKKSAVPLVVTPLIEAADAGMPMAFDIAMAVRHEDAALARELERALDRRSRDVVAILRDEGVPLLLPGGTQ